MLRQNERGQTRCRPAAVLLGLLLLLALPSAAATPEGGRALGPRRRCRGSRRPGYLAFMTTFRAALQGAIAAPVAVYAESLDLARFESPAYRRALRAWYTAKYGDRPLDAVVAVGPQVLGPLRAWRRGSSGPKHRSCSSRGSAHGPARVGRAHRFDGDHLRVRCARIGPGRAGSSPGYPANRSGRGSGSPTREVSPRGTPGRVREPARVGRPDGPRYGRLATTCRDASRGHHHLLHHALPRRGGPGLDPARRAGRLRARCQSADLQHHRDLSRSRHRGWLIVSHRDPRPGDGPRRGAGARGAAARIDPRSSRRDEYTRVRLDPAPALGPRRAPSPARQPHSQPSALAVGATSRGRADRARRARRTGNRDRGLAAGATTTAAGRNEPAPPQRTPPHGPGGGAPTDRPRPPRRRGPAPGAARDPGRGAPCATTGLGGCARRPGAGPRHQGPGAGLRHSADCLRAPSGAARAPGVPGRRPPLRRGAPRPARAGRGRGRDRLAPRRLTRCRAVPRSSDPRGAAERRPAQWGARGTGRPGGSARPPHRDDLRRRRGLRGRRHGRPGAWTHGDAGTAAPRRWDAGHRRDPRSRHPHPGARPGAGSPPRRSTPSPGRNMSKPRVLLGDDHGLLLEAFTRLLEPEVTVVGRVTDGRALVRAALELRPDVVVADVSMPELNGLEAGASDPAGAPGRAAGRPDGPRGPGARRRGLPGRRVRRSW